MSKRSDRDNRANQLNRNNDAYWQSRGEGERPEDWEEQGQGGGKGPTGREPARRK